MKVDILGQKVKHVGEDGTAQMEIEVQLFDKENIALMHQMVEVKENGEVIYDADTDEVGRAAIELIMNAVSGVRKRVSFVIGDESRDKTLLLDLSLPEIVTMLHRRAENKKQRDMHVQKVFEETMGSSDVGAMRKFMGLYGEEYPSLKEAMIEQLASLVEEQKESEPVADKLEAEKRRIQEEHAKRMKEMELENERIRLQREEDKKKQELTTLQEEEKKRRAELKEANERKNDIFYVLEKGSVEQLRELLQRKPDELNKQDKDGRTPLMISIEKGIKAYVDIVINHPDLNISLRDRDGCTALIYALKKLDKPVITKIAMQWPITAKINDNNNRTPYWYAQIMRCDQDILARLVV